MKKQLYRAAAATVLGLSLTTGIVAADTGNNIDTTGPNSSNRVTSRVSNHTRVKNNNTVKVDNDNDQSARTGDAKVWGNTRGGDAETGDASNSNRTSADVEIDNSASTNNIDPNSSSWNGGGGGSGGSISDTGPNSSNRVSSTVSNRTSVENNNRITIDNDNEQHASSGDASVSGNTRGGSAETGDASNTNSSNFTISVTN